ncbi:MAG: AbrB/MazE/SpoVT family DNA-binding domain-containing protein [Clostridiales Family XIII bacterium]|jgi:bifunctional DNA-binding transcriptional regulator/antitoxin component of YhaV-PrlF toxin-antitoxin module|nr:AbrB/MazE/SpoVT family DNA-binding domain-containing protein [Clostridiales Family XIII bacterium]
MDAIGNAALERKIISITGKRQITIPLKFHEMLRFGREAECYLTDDSIVLRPLSTSDDSFTMEILRDLVAQGYSGDKLLAKFAEQRANVKKALGLLMDEADEIAADKRNSATTADIFGED